MLSYFTALIFYTSAMVGILLIAFVVYKKFNFSNRKENRGLINIVDSCPIGPKKELLVVKIGNEKFLIASGIEHTTFLSKLDGNIQQATQEAMKSQEEQIVQNPSVQYSQKEEKDVYDFLYNQSKKLEAQKANYENDINKLQEKYNNQNKLKNLYATRVPNEPQSTIDSRRKLMQELLDEIHQSKSKSKTGSRF